MKNNKKFQFGPITAEQNGRSVVMRSNWGAGEFEAFQERLKDSRGELKNDIQNKIDKLVDLIKGTNPLELLAKLSLDNLFFDPEKYTEMTHKGREAYVEFALSLVTAYDGYDLKKHYLEKEIKEFKKLIAEIFTDLQSFYTSEATEGKLTKEEYFKRFQSIMTYLNVRGESYPEHHLEMIKEILTEHNDFLLKNFNFDAQGILTCVEDLEKQIYANMNKVALYFSKLKEIHDVFLRLPKKQVKEKMKNNEFKTWFNELPEVKVKTQEAEQYKDSLDDVAFLVNESQYTRIDILDKLSLIFGENKEFTKYENALNWPGNTSLIYNKPLIKVKDKYYLFSVQVLFRNLLDIVETWIESADKAYFLDKYLKKRSKYIESATLKYLSNVLKGASVFENVYYDNDKELDGLIIFGNYIFIIEAKAKNFSLSARRGGMERFYSDSKKIIGEAYDQAQRAKKFIMDNPVSIFFNKHKKEIVRIQRDKITEIFIITSSIKALTGISTDLNFLKDKGIIIGKEWPWAIFINDLRIISEVVQSPSFFIQFLQRRIRANDFHEVFIGDELDLFMYYLNDDLYFEDGKSKGYNMFNLVGYTETLDRYYDFVNGRVLTGEKPKRKVSEEMLVLIDKIEKTNFSCKYECAISILDFDSDKHKQIHKNIKRYIRLAEEDGKCHHFHMVILNKAKRVYCIYISPTEHEGDKVFFDHHIRMKKYEAQAEEFVVIGFDKNLNIIDLNFEMKTWVYDAGLEKNLRFFKQEKIKQIENMKAGRNDKCPCGSDIKFKKCCGKKR